MLTRAIFFVQSMRVLIIVLMVSAAACASRRTTTADASTATALASASHSHGAQPAAVERAWSIIALEGVSVEVPAERARPTLIFDAKQKRVSGMAGVNRFSGTYTMEGESLKFGPLLATKMAGPPELNELEIRYLRALERTAMWRLDGDELELRTGPRVVARFAAKP
jgi:heat shock protein HslJ